MSQDWKQGQTCRYMGEWATVAYVLADDQVIISLDDGSQETVPASALVNPVVQVTGERNGHHRQGQHIRWRPTAEGRSMRCPDCDQVVPGAFPYCDYCGADLEPKGTRCPGCKMVVPRTVRYCAYCGEYLGGHETKSEEEVI